MEEIKFASLDNEQLQALTELEEKLGVTLIAYDASAIDISNSNEIQNL